MNQWSDRTKTVVLCALALLIYGFGIGRGFVFDDPVYISENPLLRRPDGFRLFWFTSEAFNYYPLFWSLLRAQWLLWGDHSAGYHAVNLLLHCANSVLLWRIGREWRWPGAWWVAALFAVHPVNVQTVAWAAEQKNTWSFLFMGLALLAFLRHARQGGWSAYAQSFGWFVAALACKTSTVFLPPFLVLCFCLRREKSARVLFAKLVPYFAIGVAAGLTTIWFEKHCVGAQSLMGSLDLWQRLEASGAAFWFYLGKGLLPVGLTPFYQGWVDTTAAAHTALPGALLLLLLAGCALFHRRLGAPITLGLAYYALLLFPLLGIFDTNYFAFSQIADHWQYHALPGLLVAAVATASALGKKWPRLAQYPNAVGAAAVLTATALASAHFAHFEDARSLWTHTVARNPDAWLAWYNLGNIHADDRAFPEAIAAYRKSIRSKPDYHRAHFNLANTIAAAGQLEEADRAYLAARTLRDDDPDSYVNRGVLLLRMSRQDEAIAEFQTALRLDPRKTSAHVNLVTILLQRGQIAEASTHLQAVGIASEANGQRIAGAIESSWQQKAAPPEALQNFVTEACILSRNHPALLATRALLQQAR